MNYIRHLSEGFEEFTEDFRLNASYISIYYALFHSWNSNKFPGKFFRQQCNGLGEILLLLYELFQEKKMKRI